MISHNEVDTHLQSGLRTQYIQKETPAMPFLIEYTSAQTITEEQESKHQLPIVTWWCIDLVLHGYVHTSVFLTLY